MFLTLYLFSMVAGGVVLLASIVLGGHEDTDADVHAELHTGDGFDADIDADADLDLDHGDIDADADIDADIDAAHGGSLAHAHGDADADALIHVERRQIARRRSHPILGLLTSLRFWTFFTTFFGLTGAVLEGLGLAAAIPALVLALAMGSLSGATAALVLRRLAADSIGVAASSRDYVGLSGRVLVPIRKGSLGKIRLQLKGTTVDMLATCDDDEALNPGEFAMIIEMRETTAVVIRQGQLAAN